MTAILHYYRDIWLVDFEFRQPDGDQPEPHCMVAREIRTGRTLRVWADELAASFVPPFPIGEDSLFVAYFASAELNCFRALGWPMPARVLDLFCEFRNLTNGVPTISGNGLLGALAYFGLGAIAATEKAEMRELAIRGGPFNREERAALMDYCESDVLALAKLLPAILPYIDLPRALLRGRYMAAVAAMESNGVPIDAEALNTLRAHWRTIQGKLIAAVDAEYGVYVPRGRTTTMSDGPADNPDSGPLSFSAERFADWLARNGIPWPRLRSGALALDDDTFREMAKAHPVVAPLYELRQTLGKLRLESLAVGGDHRNRCLLSPYRSTTGRNQPGNARFIFGPSCWLRGLIRPGPRRAVAYVDWSQQEFGIAAALSGDQSMMQAYSSGDPYLTFAKQAGAVPAGATKQTHGSVREQFKICVLAVQYGMGSQSLAQRLGEPEIVARELLRLHRATYPKFWAWSEGSVLEAQFHRRLRTVFGWMIHVGANENPRSLANFPVQANGAEMLRLACSLATERGIAVCCPVHDALLVEGPTDEIDAVVAATQKAMREASEVVLGGFALRADAKIVRHPERYMDPRGERMWDLIWKLVDELNPRSQAAVHPHPCGGTSAPVQTRPI
jgi:hypothetical protein